MRFSASFPVRRTIAGNWKSERRSYSDAEHLVLGGFRFRARLTEVLDQHEIACGESPRKQEDLPVGGNRESEAQLSFDGGRRGYGWWRTRKTEVQMSAD